MVCRQFQYMSIAFNLAYNKTNCTKLQMIDPEICSILIFLKRVWKQFLRHILCMVFQEKCCSYYILLTDEISFPDCWHGVKVRPGPRDPPQSLKVRPETPLKFKSGTPGPPSKFKSGTLIIIFLHCLTYFVLDKYIYNMEIIFHKQSVF